LVRADGWGDILWYGRGPVADSIWYGGSHVEKRPLSITGATYRPVSGDLDGDGRDDVVWYGPGGAPDSIWYGRAQRGRFDDHRVTIGGSYTPVVADLDGNGADEVVWYGPGSHPDYLWRGVRGGRNPSGTNLAAIGGTYRPIA